MLIRGVLEKELASWKRLIEYACWPEPEGDAFTDILANIMYLQEAIEQFKRLSRKANQKAFGFAGWTVNACEFLNQWEKEGVRK